MHRRLEFFCVLCGSLANFGVIDFVWLRAEIKIFCPRVTGVKVAVGAFFNGKHFVYPVNINFEHKRFFPGNLGPPTGEMGTSMFWSMPNQLFNQTLLKMEPQLAEEGYVGYIDVNCIVNHKGIDPLEFTSPLGYPTISIQQAGMITPIGQFFWDLANGGEAKLKVRSGFQIGMRIVVPPFPFDDDETFESFSKHSAIVFRKPPTDEIHIEHVKTGQQPVACGWYFGSHSDRGRSGPNHDATPGPGSIQGSRT